MTLRRRVAVGVAWTTAYQAFSLVLSLISVLVIARIVPPDQFGLFAMTLIPLAAVNGLSTTSVVTHALFRPGADAPDWNLYFWLALLAQGSAAALCNAVAFACWFVPAYRPLAPMLHVASIGVVVDAFVRLDAVMCQRELDIRRNQFLLASCDVVSLSTSIGLVLFGFGPWGLLLGGTVFRSLPYVVHLFLIRGWKPNPSRWWTYTRDDFLPPVKFALHYSAANAGNALRQFAESALIPLAFTAAQVGYISRALGLYNQTAGRALQGFNETATAALPSLSSDVGRFRRGAAAYLTVVAGLSAAAVAFLGAAGPTFSAVLYGPKWKPADPFIFPAAMQGATMYFAAVCSTILLAGGKRRANLFLLAFLSIGAVPSLVALAAKTSPGVYLWTQALSTTVVAGLGLALCRPLVGLRSIAWKLLPPLVAAAIAGAAIFVAELILAEKSEWIRFPVDLAAFGCTHLLVTRFAFTDWLSDILTWMPKGALLRRWLWMPPIIENSTDAGATLSR